jgi:CheY-like chemotaxis protein
VSTEDPRPAGTVLYIDDSPINTMLIERILVSRPSVGFESAPDGRTGLDLAGRLIPDLILLDLKLPDISGEEVLVRLRADPTTEAIPVIIVSAEMDPAVHRRVLEQGAQWCLTKPFEVTELLGLVDGTLHPPPQPR